MGNQAGGSAASIPTTVQASAAQVLFAPGEHPAPQSTQLGGSSYTHIPLSVGAVQAICNGQANQAVQFKPTLQVRFPPEPHPFLFCVCVCVSVCLSVCVKEPLSSVQVLACLSTNSAASAERFPHRLILSDGHHYIHVYTSRCITTVYSVFATYAVRVRDSKSSFPTALLAVQAMLATQRTTLIRDGELVANAVIRLNDFLYRKVRIVYPLTET